MLLRLRLDFNAITSFVVSDVQRIAFDGPYPVGEDGVEDCVERNSDGGVGFRGFEAERVVPVETGGADGEGKVADGEARVGQGVRLREGEGVEVGGYYIVGGVFEVWGALLVGVLRAKMIDLPANE